MKRKIKGQSGKEDRDRRSQVRKEGTTLHTAYVHEQSRA